MADHYENIENSVVDVPPLRKLKSAQSDEGKDGHWPSSRETDSSYVK